VRTWALLVGLAGTLAGCFAPDFAPGQFACGDEGRCPAGLSCAADGRCYPPGGGPRPDGGRVDAGARDAVDLDAAVDAPPPADRSLADGRADVDRDGPAPDLGPSDGSRDLADVAMSDVPAADLPPCPVLTLGKNSGDTVVDTVDTTLHGEPGDNGVYSDDASVFMSQQIGSRHNGLIWFSLEGVVPEGCRVTEARLLLSFFEGTAGALGFHRVLQQWDARANWMRASGDATPWSSEGCDDTVPTDCREDPPFAVVMPGKTVLELALPPGLAQAWLEDASTNHGVLVRFTDAGTSDAHFHSNEGPDGSRPRLVLTLAP
jgi:hypothetical protein